MFPHTFAAIRLVQFLAPPARHVSKFHLPLAALSVLAHPTARDIVAHAMYLAAVK